MQNAITITVGHEDADLLGDTHRVLQAAVDYVSSFGGGTVKVLPGTYRMGNAVHLRDNVRLIGSGEETVLLKNPSRSTPLTDDADWYDWAITVEDPSCFEVGGGLLLRGKHVSNSGRSVITKHTVVAIEGHTMYLDRQPREDAWITHEATASTLFPIVTGNYVKDIAIENLTIDGNREANDHLDGNYGGCIFLQDCQRVLIQNVTTHNNEGDGISWQVCDDVTVEHCRSLNNRDLGLHPGSGSQRPIIRHNIIRNCRIGLFWCWGVKHGIAEHNEIHDSGDYGISIGHRDTDNTMRHNLVRNSGKVGIFFRTDEPIVRAAHRNVVESNVIENAGAPDTPGTGIELAGAVDRVVLRANRITSSEGGHMETGIRIAEAVTNLTLDGNRIEGAECDVEDLRA